MWEDEDTYISLGTGHAGYVSSTGRRKPKNPIGFTLPKTEKASKTKASTSAVSRQPKRKSATRTPRARVTKSAPRRQRTTKKR